MRYTVHGKIEALGRNAFLFATSVTSSGSGSPRPGVNPDIGAMLRRATVAS